VKPDVQRSTFYVPLVRAILGLPDDGLRCDECRAWLPTYVDAEIGGLSGGARHLPVKHHLLLCPGCATLYLELLELGLAEEQNSLPQLRRYPEPDLSFLCGEHCNDRPQKK
jgi:hypothetical protein